MRRPTKIQQEIVESSRQYSRFLEKNLVRPVVKRDLAFKHQSMAADSFQFLRATFFRFIQLWPVLLPGLSAAPHGTSLVLSLSLSPCSVRVGKEGRANGYSLRCQCSPSVICTWRITELGATRKAVGCGVSMTLTRPSPWRTQSVWIPPAMHTANFVY